MLTIGHSTHTIEEFISLLRAHGATLVADVRMVPGSRHNPQFDKASFRGYADYMQTPEFEQSLDELVQLSNQEAVVLFRSLPIILG